MFRWFVGDSETRQIKNWFHTKRDAKKYLNDLWNFDLVVIDTDDIYYDSTTWWE